MAGQLVGGAFLSASLQVLFDRLASREFLSLVRAKKLDEKLLGRLKTTLYAASAVLNDAEYKQIKDSGVKNWLDDLRDAVYVADDVFDEMSTRAATQKEVSNFFSRCLESLIGGGIGSKIEDITCRLESIVRNKDILNLKESERKSVYMRHQSTSLVEECEVYGREKDEEAVINLLLDDSGDNNLSVIPIVGMGGSGKTTLAQLVYNDDNVKQNFDPKAWVCVSEEFNVSKVTKTIIEALTCKVCNIEGLNSLQLDLKEKLLGKKFLIVLDDVWNESYVDWDLLRKPFQYGEKGSKILLTTRSERVASVVQTIPNSYHLDELSDDNCWLLFAKHARLSINSGVNLDLAEVGRDIVKKCKRLPLAITVLGGLLGLNHDIEHWKTILKSDLWDLPIEESEIFPALRISYHYLSPCLKQCFAYCSLFPKDYPFDKEELILLWMAEGFLQSPKVEITLEEVGSVYLDILTERSFFQCSSNFSSSRFERFLTAVGRTFFAESMIDFNKVLIHDHHEIRSPRYKFFMHDLIHDLSISVGGKFFHSLEVGNGNKIPKTTRHLSCDVANVDVALSTVEKESLRALVVKNMNSSQQMTETHINTLMLSKCLRVLSIRGFTNLEELPDSIGELIHLRYLDLSSTNIKRLPESLCKLHNLQTLKLEHCQFLTMLPNSMQDLVNLRYLDVSGTSLREMPRGIGKLKNLQFLSDFVISKNAGAKIEEIGGLPSLCKYLGIWNLESVSNSNEALEAKMMYKNRLETLLFKWSRDDEDTIDSQNEREILDKLQPHSNLKRLTIDGYRGTRFPDWLGLSSYHNMVYLWIRDCKNCCMLPPLGQLPSLKELIVQGLDSVVSIGPEFYKSQDFSSETLTSFASLESLEFRFMFSWGNWSSLGMEAFPKLQRLRLYFCCELTGDLPKSQQHLALEVDQCPALLNRCIPESSVEDLTIKYSCECDLLPSFPSHTFSNLKHLKIIGEYDGVKCFPEDGLLTDSLNTLELDGFSCLEMLDCEVFRSMASLEQVTIRRCSKLDKMAVEKLAASVRSHIKIEACDLIQAEEVPHLTNVHVLPDYVVRLEL